MKSRKSLNLENGMTHLSNYGVNGISLHYVGFELIKKVLLVALGIWLSISCRVALVHVHRPPPPPLQNL